jgi:hypothetical protein
MSTALDKAADLCSMNEVKMKCSDKSRKEDHMNENGTVVRFGHELSASVRVPIQRPQLRSVD